MVIEMKEKETDSSRERATIHTKLGVFCSVGLFTITNQLSMEYYDEKEKIVE